MQITTQNWKMVAPVKYTQQIRFSSSDPLPVLELLLPQSNPIPLFAPMNSTNSQLSLRFTGDQPEPTLCSSTKSPLPYPPKLTLDEPVIPIQTRTSGHRPCCRPTPTSATRHRIAIAVDLSGKSTYAVKCTVQNYLRPSNVVILLYPSHLHPIRR